MFDRHAHGRLILAGIGVMLLLVVVFKLPVGQQLNLAMAPLLSALKAPAQWLDEFSLWLTSSQRLQAENLDLSVRIAQQAGLRQELLSLREENLRLRALLKLQAIPDFTWVAAKVEGRSPDKMSQRLVIRVAGTKPDDVIVSSDGLVGIVDQGLNDYAVVRTILDASVAVPVTRKEMPLAAIVRGQGDHLLVDFATMEDAPEVGEVLYTSGAGGLYPSGLPVVRVTRVTPVPGKEFASIEAVPVAHWKKESWLAVASRAAKDSP